MTAIVQTLAELVEAVIQARLDPASATPFVVQNVETAISYFPITSAEELNENGKVWILALTADETVMSRSRAANTELPVQLCLMKQLVDPRDTNEVKVWVEFHEELRDTCRKLVDPSQRYAWLRNEALRDETGSPYGYQIVKDTNIFMVQFNAFYHYVIHS